MRRGWLALALGAAGGVSSTVNADSVFSSVGYGRWNHAVDVRSAALGDVSIVPNAAWSFSPRNPATLAGIRNASAYLSFSGEFTTPDVGADAGTRSDGRLPLLAAASPIYRTIVVGVHVRELNDARYHIAQSVDDPTDEFPAYELRMKGSGAWTELGFTGAGRFGPWMLGAQIGIPFSALEDEVTRAFEEDGYSDRTLVTRTELNEAVFTTLGVGFAQGAFSAGAFVQAPQTGLVATTLELEGEDSETIYSLRTPEAYGVGASVLVGRGLSVAGEFRRQPWGGSTELRGQPWRDVARSLGITRDFVDVDAWGVGIEWNRGALREARSSLQRLLLRAGYSTQPWNVAGPTNGEVSERAWTAGLGVPFVRGNGEVSLAVRYAKREEAGSSYREDALLLMFALAYARQPRDY
jgi:hypothetical protein